MPPPAPLRGIRRRTAVPCLMVGDIATAVDYYRDVLGFGSARRLGSDTAVVRGHGSVLQLRQVSSDQLEQARSCHDGGPDAVLLVDAPRATYRRLDDQGAHLMPAADLGPDWDGCFGAADCYRNVLAFGPVSGPRAAVRWIAEPLDSLARRRHERRRARAEAPHLAEPRSFYEGLADKRDIIYVFFSGRLLHWVRKALSYVPADVNVVLLGSDLPADELDWVRENLRRPFHHIRLRIDDQIAWEFLFAVNRQHFGWLDSDCLVLDDRIFAELADIRPDTALNCVWSWDSGRGFPLANTFLLFVNVDVIEAVRARGIDPSPYSHDYEWQNLRVPGRRCYSRRPSRPQLRALRRLLTVSGRPPTPYGMSYFDTMVMYQMLARACGYDIHRVRELGGFGHIHGRPVQDESSDELLHIGGGSKADALDELSGFFHEPAVRILYLVAETVMLDEADRLPPYYAERRAQIAAVLERHGLTTQLAEEMIRQHLMEVRGMSERGANAVLRRSVAQSMDVR